MSTQFIVTGMDKLKRHIDKMSNTRLVFDDDYSRAARRDVSEIVRTTPKLTGVTASNWTKPKKLGLSNYEVENKEMTSDGKYSIPRILNTGRLEVLPVNCRALYIPLSNKGRSKKAGEKIPAGLVFGIDYVWAKKSKAYAGTGYITKANATTRRLLISDMIATIRRVHSGE